MRAALSMMLALAVLAFLPLSIAVPGTAISNASVSRAAFNSISGRDNISYSVSDPSNGSVTVAIVSPGGTIDRTIAGGSAAGRNSITWDGKYGNGSPVREGRYTAWILYIPPDGPAFTQGQRFARPAGIVNASVAIIVDNTAPYTNVTTSGSRGDDGNFTEAVQASLTATDSLSGVNMTEYRLDGGPWSRYSGAVAIGEGSHALQYRSTDRAGNIETARSVPVNVSISPSPTPGTGPRVISTVPGDIAVDVPVGSIVSAWFDRDMDSGSINSDTFRLVDDTGDYVSGTVDYGTAAVFIPAQPLEQLTQYRALIRNVTDEQGNRISGDYEWTFITGAVTTNDNTEDDYWNDEVDWQDDTTYPQNTTTDEPVYDTGIDNVSTGIDNDITTIDNISDSGQVTDPAREPIDNTSGGVDEFPVQQNNLPVIILDLNSIPSLAYVAGGFVFMALVAAGYLRLNKKFIKK
jgi:hypothetical protein